MQSPLGGGKRDELLAVLIGGTGGWQMERTQEERADCSNHDERNDCRDAIEGGDGSDRGDSDNCERDWFAQHF